MEFYSIKLQFSRRYLKIHGWWLQCLIALLAMFQREILMPRLFLAKCNLENLQSVASMIDYNHLQYEFNSARTCIAPRRVI